MGVTDAKTTKKFGIGSAEMKKSLLYVKEESRPYLDIIKGIILYR